MTTTDLPDRPDTASQVYRAFWRWHFYAGFLILPVLMLMALTGGLYLFKDEIDSVVYRPLQTVEARAGATLPSAWVASAERGLGGKVIQLTRPAAPDSSAKLVVAVGKDKRTAYVDPHDARLLGSTPDGGVMQVVKRLHSLDIAGPVANMLVEVVAGWAIVMVATGVFLWWPRGQAGGVVTIRAAPARRVFWRDLHAVTGVFAAGVILFLAVTGMPWSAVWGQQVRKFTNEAGMGKPTPPAGASEIGHEHHTAAEARSDALPWALQHTEMHMVHAMGGDAMAPPSVDAVVAQVDASGLGKPYVLSIPSQPGKAWSAAYMPDRIEDVRTLYIDGASGTVIGDIGFRKFGPAAKAIEWGIAVHQGEEFGWVNKLVMLAGCIAIWLLGISATVMWWKRRPKGRLAVPPRPADRRAYVGLALIVVPLGLIYPLVGASLLTVLALDIVVRRTAKTFRRGPAPRI